MPDIGQIASVELRSYGYQNAHTIALKIIMLFRLCAQYLPSKQHYDFGMRSIKAVLNSAKASKAERGVTNEEAVIASAICHYSLCKMEDFDLDVFRTIFNDIFPGQLVPSKSDPNHPREALLRAVADACAAVNIDCTEYFQHKITQLHQLQQMTIGVIIIGNAYSGKTTLYRMLANALALCGERNELNEIKPDCKGKCEKLRCLR